MMTFGEKIKQLRMEKNLTQPQLAEAIGIEQSYLSKLENDRCVPSADIFNSLIKQFSLNVSAFLDSIDEGAILSQLRQIPEVANYTNKKMAQKVNNVKRWIFGSALACIVGLSLTVAGSQAWIFPSKAYNYYSAGVLHPGEPTNLFSEFGAILMHEMVAGRINNVEMNNKVVEYKNRIDERSQTSLIYKGDSFILTVDGGTRFYSYKNQINLDNNANRYLMILGTLFAISGFFGFWVEHRLQIATNSST